MTPCNVWLIDSPEMVLSFSLQGGRIIFITEDKDPRFEYLPNQLSASILLPPYEALSAELDGDMDTAQYKYYEYLSSEVPSEFIIILLAAAIQGIQIGLYFGPELNDLKYPMMLIDYLYTKGLSIGYRQTMPFLVDEALPTILAILYGKNIINGDAFLMRIPFNMDIPPFILPRLVQEYRPVFVNNQDYNKYFKELGEAMKKAGKPLRCPIVAPEVI